MQFLQSDTTQQSSPSYQQYAQGAQKFLQSDNPAIQGSSGAAIGAGVGSVIPGVGTAIGSAVGYVIGQFNIHFKGKTKHLSYNQALPLAVNLGTVINNNIENNVTANQMQQIDATLPVQLAEWMNTTHWWKVGNDVAHLQIEAVANKTNALEALQNFFIWVLCNAPADNVTDAFAATQEGFNATLYPMLDSMGANNLHFSIQSGLAQQQANIAIQQGNVTTGQVQSPATQPQPQNANTLASLFQGNNLIITAIVVFLLVGMLFSKKG